MGIETPKPRYRIEYISYASFVSMYLQWRGFIVESFAKKHVYQLEKAKQSREKHQFISKIS